MLEATNYMLSNQSSANQSKGTANKQLVITMLLELRDIIKFKTPPFIYERMPHMGNTSEMIQNMWMGPHKMGLVEPRQKMLSCILTLKYCVNKI